MTSMKKLTIIGNVGADPESHSNQDGSKFATFNLAVNFKVKDNQRTEWTQVCCNGPLHDLAMKNIKSGMKLYIEGFPRYRTYTNKNNIVEVTEQIYPIPGSIVFISSPRTAKESFTLEHSKDEGTLSDGDIPSYSPSEYSSID